MIRGEFEKELEQYLAHRRKAKIKFPNLFRSLKKKKKMPEPELPPEIEKYDEGAPAEPLSVMPGEETEEKPGFMTKLFQTLGLVSVDKTGAEAIPQEQVQHMLAKDEVTQDMKEIAKIALLVIKHLPPEELESFKAGPEFSRLKELLKKHQLIK